VARNKHRLVVTSDIPHTNFEALIPERLEDMGWEVFYNPPRGTECDFWIVFSVARNQEWMQCAVENTLYLAGEPPSKKVHPRAFYEQFNHVVSLNPEDPHPAVKVECPCLNWHVGLDLRKECYDYGYAQLKAMKPPKKINKISVICSNLRTTEGQRERLTFLDDLKQRLGDRLVHFGKGFTPINDKMDGILPYALHLVLENERTPHYWTEKLADTYLGFAYPFYLGAPNIEDYFPTSAVTSIDPDRVDLVAEEIIRLLDCDHQLLQNEVRIARALILDRYNFFTNAVRLASKNFDPHAKPGKKVIWSHKAFRKFPRNHIFRIASYFCPEDTT
jgi:hypothetical protein